MRFGGTTMKPIPPFSPKERGVALVTVVLALTALMAVTVVAVDVGRLAFTATEVQTAAEAAATGGVRTLFSSGNASTGAQQMISQNKINGALATSSNLQSVQSGNFNYGNG